MRTKYPRTPHFPWSPGATSDDRVLASIEHLRGRELVVTVKMDGENTTIYRDGYHARSLDSKPHPSRNHVGALYGRIRHELPGGWRVCGENLFAEHSIGYSALADYFLVYSIWDETNTCLAWDETLEWCRLLELSAVPVLDEGLKRVEQLVGLVPPARLGPDLCEGYVARVAGRFHYDDFAQSVAKWVRPNHVQTDEHWMSRPVKPNRLRAP